MGGLAHRMRRTAPMIVLGAVALAGLPPLAGFTGEWLVYRGLLDGGLASSGGAGSTLWLLFAIAVLAAVGVLAALCVVRIVGIALLGRARTEAAAHAHESSAGMLVPMAVLAAGIVAMPLVAPWLVGWFGPVVRQIGHGSGAASTAISTAAPAAALAPIAWLSLALWAALGGGLVVLRRLSSRARGDDTWGCGYAAPTPRMQYTGASFAESMQQLLPRALRARTEMRREPVLFPHAGALGSDREDPFTRSVYEPLFDRLGKRFAQLRWVQQGVTHLYVLYIVVTVVGALAAVAIRDRWVSP
jgi:hydrogenase-4 component B